MDKQLDFHVGRSCTDNVIVLPQILEKRIFRIRRFRESIWQITF